MEERGVLLTGGAGGVGPGKGGGAGDGCLVVGAESILEQLNMLPGNRRFQWYTLIRSKL